MTCTIFNTKGLGASSESFSDGKGNLRYDPEQLKGQFTGVAATPHPILWDVTGPILLLGSWCEPSLAQFSNVTYAVLPNRWANRALIRSAEQYCWNFFTRLIPQIAERLNVIHGTCHPVGYWEFLLSSWLLHAIHGMYDRYLLACDVRRLALGASLRVPSQTASPPTTFAEGVDRFCSDDGNLLLFSLVFKELGLDVIIESADSTLVQASRHRFGERLLQFLYSQLKLSAHRVLSRPSGMRLLASVSHMSLLDCFVLAMRVPGLRVPVLSVGDMSLPFSVDRDRRSALKDIPSDSEFERVFIRLLSDIIPATMVEHYEKVVTLSHRFYGNKEVPIVITNLLQESLLEFAARSKCVGCPVSIYQHGGGYDQYHTYPLERIEIAKGQTFLSWGGQGDHIQKLPSPHLSRLRDRHRGGSRIVLVEICMPKYLYRIHSKPICQNNRLFECMLSFVEALPEELLREVVLKPDPGFDQYETRHGTRRPKTLQRLLPRKAKARLRAFHLMPEARMVIVPYPETTFIEALSVNVPTIGVWDPSLFEMRSDAEPFYSALAAVGVIHSDPIAAAQQVIAVYQDANKWWRDESIQKARISFLNRFGMASADWRNEWASYLNSLV